MKYANKLLRFTNFPLFAAQLKPIVSEVSVHLVAIEFVDENSSLKYNFKLKLILIILIILTLLHIKQKKQLVKFSSPTASPTQKPHRQQRHGCHYRGNKTEF